MPVRGFHLGMNPTALEGPWSSLTPPPPGAALATKPGTRRKAQPMRREDVEILDRETVYRGYFRIDRVRLRYPRFAGGMGPVVVREVAERGHAVAVLPYDPVRDEIVLIEQFRVAAYDAGWHPWLVEIVAGIIDEGETPEGVARREAGEEAGLDLGELVHICDFQPSPGVLTETIRLYCARVDAEGAGGLHGLEEEAEDIRAFRAPFDEAMAMFESGRINNSIVVIALLWLALHRERLRAEWNSGATTS